MIRSIFVAYLAVASLATLPVWGSPIVPNSDGEIVERLPASTIARRAALQDAAAALPVAGSSAVVRLEASARAAREARVLLDAARLEGDPRPAGQALALLAPWANDSQAPPNVVMMLATVEQFLHAFDSARGRLEALVHRDPRQPQAWLTLATLYRLRGWYDRSDQACGAVMAAGATVYGSACLAENQAMRGEIGPARASLNRLIGATRQPSERGWLLTTLAELEQRAGRPLQAEAAYRAALQADHDGYTALGYADFLIDQKRPADALAALAREPRSDAVLLRLAIAGRQANAPAAAADEKELTERFEQAALRPGGTSGHAREHAMYQLDIRHDARAALMLAGENLIQQREPIDLLIYARAARAAGANQALAALASLKTTMHFYDRRLDPLL